MKYTEVVHQNYHMQGFTTDGENMYWSFTDSLVKTKKSGLMLRQTQIFGGHLGDIVYYDGKIYGSVMGNAIKGRPFWDWVSFEIHVFDAGTLALERVIRLDECYEMHEKREDGFLGIDGITVLPETKCSPARLLIASALFSAEEYDSQIFLEYSLEGQLIQKRCVKTGNTSFGIQNLTRDPDNGDLWFSTYGGSAEHPYQNKNFLFRMSKDYEILEEYNLCTPYGLEALGGGKFYLSVQGGENGNRQGYAYEADLEFIRSTEIDGENHRPWFVKKWWDEKLGL